MPKHPPAPTPLPGVPPPDPGALPWYLSPAPPQVGLAGKLAPPIAIDWSTERERRAVRERERERERAQREARERAARRAAHEDHHGKSRPATVALPTKVRRPYDVRCPVCAAERSAFCLGAQGALRRNNPHRERRLASRFGRADLSAQELRALEEQLRRTLPGEQV